MRRKSLLDIEKYLPLPELVGHSEILTEAYLRQVSDLLCINFLSRDLFSPFLCCKTELDLH